MWPTTQFNFFVLALCKLPFWMYLSIINKHQERRKWNATCRLSLREFSLDETQFRLFVLSSKVSRFDFSRVRYHPGTTRGVIETTLGWPPGWYPGGQFHTTDIESKDCGFESHSEENFSTSFSNKAIKLLKITIFIFFFHTFSHLLWNIWLFHH
jgi:hypothetical protein